MDEITAPGEYIPYDSPEYVRDEQGNIKIYNPEPAPPILGHMNNYYSSEPLLKELADIKESLKQILDKL